MKLREESAESILPKKSVVASCLPQLSPVKSSNASLVNICRLCQNFSPSYFTSRNVPLCISEAR